MVTTQQPCNDIIHFNNHNLVNSNFNWTTKYHQFSYLIDPKVEGRCNSGVYDSVSITFISFTIPREIHSFYMDDGDSDDVVTDIAII